jgi:hypothetical protein
VRSGVTAVAPASLSRGISRGTRGWRVSRAAASLARRVSRVAASRDRRSSLDSLASVEARDSRDSRASVEARDSRDSRASVEARDSRDSRASVEARDPRDSRACVEARDSREGATPGPAAAAPGGLVSPELRTAPVVRVRGASEEPIGPSAELDATPTGGHVSLLVLAEDDAALSGVTREALLAPWRFADDDG